VTPAAFGSSLVDLPRAPNRDALELFVEAYQRDPDFSRAFWDGQSVPTAALRALFRAAYAAYIAAQPPLALIDAGRVVAVATYVLPSMDASTNPAYGLYALWTGLGRLRVPFRVRRRLRWYSHTALRLLPVRPRCLVGQLAVAPSEQGRGHARTLLEAIRERSRADPLSKGVALATYSESNVRLYERLGFQVTGRSSQGATRVWALFAPH
jgi:GNAT superfamily N-acetyltransferase